MWLKEISTKNNTYITLSCDSYQVIVNAKDSENDNIMVVCKSLKAPEQYWIIPSGQFPGALECLNNRIHPNKDYNSLMGKYRHFKNKEYETFCVAINTETNEEIMVYQVLYGNFDVWARPLSMFLGYKEEKRKRIKRFEKIK